MPSSAPPFASGSLALPTFRPPNHDEWISAEVLRESFVHSQKLQDATDTQFETNSEATVELFTHFLAFVANGVNSDPNSSRPRASLLYNAFKHFTESHLASQDVHTFTSTFDIDVRRAVISYFKALATLESSGITEIPRQPPSALFSATRDGDASIYTVFGGQGTNEVYFDKLQNLYDLYTPYVAPFIQIITDELFAPLSAHPPSLMIMALTPRHGCPDLHLSRLCHTWLPSLSPSRLSD